MNEYGHGGFGRGGPEINEGDHALANFRMVMNVIKSLYWRLANSVSAFSRPSFSSIVIMELCATMGSPGKVMRLPQLSRKVTFCAVSLKMRPPTSALTGKGTENPPSAEK
jgi:hypothetical protein